MVEILSGGLLPVPPLDRNSVSPEPRMFDIGVLLFGRTVLMAEIPQKSCHQICKKSDDSLFERDNSDGKGP